MSRRPAEAEVDPALTLEKMRLPDVDDIDSLPGEDAFRPLARKVLTRLGTLRDAALAALDYVDKTCDAFLDDDDSPCGEAEGALATLLFRAAPAVPPPEEDDAALTSPSAGRRSDSAAAESAASARRRDATSSASKTAARVSPQDAKDADSSRGRPGQQHQTTTRGGAGDKSNAPMQRQRPGAPREKTQAARSHSGGCYPRGRGHDKRRPAGAVAAPDRDEKAPTDLGDEEWVLIRDSPPNLDEWSVVSITAS